MKNVNRQFAAAAVPEEACGARELHEKCDDEIGWNPDQDQSIEVAKARIKLHGGVRSKSARVRIKTLLCDLDHN